MENATNLLNIKTFQDAVEIVTSHTNNNSIIHNNLDKDNVVNVQVVAVVAVDVVHIKIVIRDK